MNISVLPLVKKLGDNVQNFCKGSTSELKVIGIRTGGIWIAEHLADTLAISAPLGVLDISFYRDDFSRIGMDPKVQPTTLPWDVDGQNILLVDDILHSGRTIRAALDQIFDFGRPASVRLAVLVDRSGRELPIQADFIGTEMVLEDNQQVKLTGPEPLELCVETLS